MDWRETLVAWVALKRIQLSMSLGLEMRLPPVVIMNWVVRRFGRGWWKRFGINAGKLKKLVTLKVRRPARRGYRFGRRPKINEQTGTT